jgi:hypothetical protein
MNKVLGLGAGLLVVAGMVSLCAEARAQRPGSTAQGDILRGQGRYLEGAGWYELNSARARNIDVDTWKKHNLEVQRLYRAYLEDRYLHIRYKKTLRKGVQDDWKKKYEEDQRRWRENPTSDDISSGNALNALAGDLADPSIAPTAWQYASVALPQGLSLTSLAFQIADSRSSRLLQSTVAIDRMTISEGWPLWLRRPELKTTEAVYEQAVGTVMEKCRKGAPLEAKDVDTLREAVVALQKKVPEIVPGRDNQRAKAIAYVNQLDGTTRIFAEQTYAERLIRDVAEHQAATVAELLGFMRYHRLLFSDPGTSPELAQLYEGLYQRLRQQKEKLGVAGVPPGGLAAQRAEEPAPPARTARKGRNSAAGAWLHQNRSKIILQPNGTIINGRARGNWTQNGNVVVLRWPNREAPGGAWADRVRLSPDGNSYDGRNQNGAHIFGKRAQE